MNVESSYDMNMLLEPMGLLEESDIPFRDAASPSDDDEEMEQFLYCAKIHKGRLRIR